MAASSFSSGLSATSADQQKTIPALNPDRELFLEYDISQLIYCVLQLNKKRLGLVTSLPLMGSPQAAMMGQSPQASQYVIGEWQDTFTIVNAGGHCDRAPPNLDALAIVHPRG